MPEFVWVIDKGKQSFKKIHSVVIILISFVFMFAVMLSCLYVWKFGEGALIVWFATYVGDNLFVWMTTLIVFMCFLFSIT